MNVRMGIAPDSWGVWVADDPRQPPWQQFLNESAQAGYEGIELGPTGYLPNDVPTLRKELDCRGLKAVAATVVGPLEEPSEFLAVEEEARVQIGVISELGGEFLVLIGANHTDTFTGARLGPPKLDDTGWSRTIDSIHKIAEIAREQGLRLTYHPHADGHIEYEDQIETLLNLSDPALVSVCLDTGHHFYRDGNPTSFMRQHHERIPYVHLKSINGEVLRRVKAERLPMGRAVELGVFCEPTPTEGSVDFRSFRDVLEEVGYDGWAVVEQDMFPVPSFDVPLPIATRTRQFFRDLGMG